MISVKLFAMLKDLAGTDALEVPLPDGGTARDLVPAVIAMRPKLAEPFRDRSVLVVINRRYASLDDRLSEGDEVAFLPPVSGG